MTDIILNTMSLSLLNSIKYLLTKHKNKNIIIDPISCLIKLSLFNHLEPGTKLSIFDNKINFNNPNYGQGIIRFIYGDNREDLHNLYNPIIKAIEWFSDINGDSSNLDLLFNETISGLTRLKKSYDEYSTIQHTIDYYIILISNRHKKSICNNIPNLSNIQDSKSYKKKSKKNRSMHSDGNDNNFNKHNQYDTHNEYKQNHDKHSKNYEQTIDKSNNRKGIDRRESDVREEDKRDGTRREADNRENDNRDKEGDGSGKGEENNPELYNSDINAVYKRKGSGDDENSTQLFLKKLWNGNEINIIIQLFEEYKRKTEEQEKKHIYDNIINYCDMKEVKLNKFLEKQYTVLD